jgi:hypothetical protein
MGGGGGTSSVAGNSGRAGVGGADAAVAMGGAAGATRDSGASNLRDGAVESTSDGPGRWRNSANTLCVPTSVGSGAASVYSDGSNLFAMAWTPTSSKPPASGPATLWANDGSGWRTQFTWSKDAEFPTRYYAGNRAGIRGRVDGALFAFGRYGCAIELVDELGAHCSGAVPSVADLFVAGGNTAYATDGYYLLKYDGGVWTQVGGRFPLGDAAMVQGYALWADKSTVVVGGDNGYVLVIRDEKTVTVLPKPAEAYNITGIWAWSANDIWAATEAGDLFRYDGSQWTLKWTPPAYMGGGPRLWGADGHLFFVSWGTFAEWDGTGLRSLLPSDQSNWQFTDVWGNSATEVFAASVATSDAQIGSCNAVQVWWYDGTTARTM